MMPPIAVHHTAVSDTGGWDGPKNKANLNLHDTEAYYRQAFAWQDSEGDPENKSTYKFIHHLVSESGEVGAASLSGCIMGIGILNGARTGTTIPDADYKGVWSHLAAHIRDDDREPPELKAYQPGIMRAGSSAPNREERVLSMPQLEIRSGDGSNPPMIVGYAAVFNQPSEILNDWTFGGFREFISPGAFTKTLKDGADVRALVNHNPDYVLGRTKSGTLRLNEDIHGLHMEIQPPATHWAEDLMTTMQRGDMDGSSFGFQAIRDRWGTGATEDGQTVDERWVLEAKLFDVSVVTYPAYPQSEAQVRSLFAAAGFDVDALARAVIRAQRQLPLSVRDREILRAAVEQFRSYLPDEPVVPITAPIPVSAENHPAEVQPSAPISDAPLLVRHADHPLSYYLEWLKYSEKQG